VAHYRTILGKDLARILCADGWTPGQSVSSASHVVLWKGDHKPIPIILFRDIPKKRVEGICKTVGISADLFQKLFVIAPVPAWMAPVVH
jgi:hypothetical protein